MIDRTVDPKTLDVLDKAFDSLPPYVKEHDQKTGLIAEYLANSLFPKSDTSSLHYAASYHDLGENKLSNAILMKTSPLNPAECKALEEHPVATYEMLKDTLGEKVALMARHHHELLDGSGYPDQLRCEAITPEERVIVVADIFDALVSERPY
jgi:HD-GYP domain-containing protein (c-di-GMP phosphodiesterase class II)